MNSDNIYCPICKTNNIKNLREVLILNKHNVPLYFCDSCKFAFLSKPFWLDEAYTNVISDLDVGLVYRNIFYSNKISNLLYFVFGNPKYKILDDAGGYGLFVRLMRDLGFDYFWNDIYCENIFAKNFEKNTESKYLIVTALEVMEHTEYPIEYISKVFDNYSSDTLIFTTETFKSKIPDTNWWYYNFEGGQHISFFSKRTFKIIANKLHLKYYNSGTIHILTKKSLNSIFIKLLLSRFSLLFNLYIRKMKKSKIQSDYIASKIRLSEIS